MQFFLIVAQNEVRGLLHSLTHETSMDEIFFLTELKIRSIVHGEKYKLHQSV